MWLFCQVSQLVVSEIVRRPNINARINAIEKWAAVADISRCLHNYNGVLQICAAFTNSAVFRLKKTWDKVSKTVIMKNLVFFSGRSLKSCLAINQYVFFEFQRIFYQIFFKTQEKNLVSNINMKLMTNFLIYNILIHIFYTNARLNVVI